MSQSVLFFGKRGDQNCEQAANFVEQNFPDSQFYFSSRSEKLPAEAKAWEGDYIISYLCSWVLPGELLERANVAAINFHPGSPHYPGIGCTNFALYEEAEEFGVTCHHMNPQVDSGAIIATKMFPILPSDSVLSLTQRCYAHILSLFYDVSTTILRGDELPTSEQKWTRPAFTRKQLNALCEVTPEMSPDEVKRRVRALKYPGYPGAYIEIAGKKFAVDPDAEL